MLQCKAFGVLTRRRLHLRQGRPGAPTACPSSTRPRRRRGASRSNRPVPPTEHTGLSGGSTRLRHLCPLRRRTRSVAGKTARFRQTSRRDNGRNEHKPRKSAHSEEDIELVTGDLAGGGGGVFAGWLAASSQLGQRACFVTALGVSQAPGFRLSPGSSPGQALPERRPQFSPPRHPDAECRDKGKRIGAPI